MTAALALYEPRFRAKAPETIALCICAGLGLISLLVPPFMFSDQGWGFMAWRGTLEGFPNAVLSPDPSDIARDSSTFLAAWSPGQYLIPGALSLLGMPIGMAIAITVAACSCAYLLGWLTLVRKFAVLSAGHAVMLVLFLASFRFATLPYGNYDGGEILLQAATPWVLVGAFKLAALGFFPGLALSFVLLLIAFLAKLSGLILVPTAIACVALFELVSRRRLGAGIWGAGLGVLAGLVLVYVFYISQGWTAVHGGTWSFPANKIAGAFVLPWLAGLSWTEAMDWFLLKPGHPLVADPDLHVWFVLPAALLGAVFVQAWKPETPPQRRFKHFALLFYAVTAFIFAILFAHGADITLEERHFRPAGILLFLSAFLFATGPTIKKWWRLGFLSLCVVMSLYGLSSLAARAGTSLHDGSLDRYSWTGQRVVDPEAIAFLRDRFAHEGRGALYVLPSPDVAVAMPPNARILALSLDFMPESAVAAMAYRGHVRGHLYVTMQSRIADTAKGRALLAAFKGYCKSCWLRKTIRSTAIFIST